MCRFQKHEIALRYFLLGAGWHRAVAAMDYAKAIHTGTRKDGYTPAFAHQVAIANYLRTLMVPAHSPDQRLTRYAGVIYPEETLCAVFLHDTREDGGVSHDEILQIFLAHGHDAQTRDFAARTADAVEYATKKFRGTVKDKDAYFAAIAACPITCLVKGGDRVHNFQTMNALQPDGSPVFGLDKQRDYIAEGRHHFLPMLKAARRAFPAQEGAIENIKHMLLSQIELLEAVHSHWDPA